MQMQRWLMSLLIISALVTGGCSPQETSPLPSDSSSAATTSAATVPPANSSQFSNLPRLEGKATVELMVKGKPITIEVDGSNAPITAGNFVDLVQRGVYDGLVFHRVVREPQPFVVQGGDPQSKDPNFPLERVGTSGFVDSTGQPRLIPLVIKPTGATVPTYSQTLNSLPSAPAPQLKHTRGAVAMARSMAPDSASSQFYIALADLKGLDGDYAVFGYVTQGMDVVDKIQQGDRIESAKVIKGADNLKQGGATASPSPSPSPQ
jgi:peptidyl-prolyl cis-trans isomerase B (cyclophilin B)